MFYKTSNKKIAFLRYDVSKHLKMFTTSSFFILQIKKSTFRYKLTEFISHVVNSKIAFLRYDIR